MVVEFLTFEVDASEQSDWLAVEEGVWSRFLEQQPGFVRKEMWRRPGRANTIHAVIWWETRAEWKAITPERVATVDRRMADWLRHPTCVEYEVVRER